MSRFSAVMRLRDSCLAFFLLNFLKLRNTFGGGGVHIVSELDVPQLADKVYSNYLMFPQLQLLNLQECQTDTTSNKCDINNH